MFDRRREAQAAYIAVLVDTPKDAIARARKDSAGLSRRALKNEAKRFTEVGMIDDARALFARLGAPKSGKRRLADGYRVAGEKELDRGARLRTLPPGTVTGWGVAPEVGIEMVESAKIKLDIAATLRGRRPHGRR